MGVYEDKHGMHTSHTKVKIFNEITNRVERLCKTQLNGKNLVHAINENAISVINYYCGILEIMPNEYEELDKKIRSILCEHKIHFKNANMERLYLPRNMLGRGINNVVQKTERILYQMNNFLTKHAGCLRKRIILK